MENYTPQPQGKKEKRKKSFKKKTLKISSPLAGWQSKKTLQNSSFNHTNNTNLQKINKATLLLSREMMPIKWAIFKYIKKI